ncbi:vitamin B12 ABC transporter ATP-binding protein BtuD [Cronobacter muytjensii]|uniref:vitamin B12 ABC transporter ATP-binding protein BtuD n=1 Tax=Cronobacter muytjensii TaxID=413501 RepID=UPI002A12655C|nr:vitamin B12 ABC transporter ATP-binding protein BtuD [Cronobacter muytjensii]ELY6273206.1 vitamin B12 ABC transporter ATP-binding protein BtuD [Cronobacter muytjensii]MEB8639331.1 vitamin B12 ABC transporter ATP-binding protein BtuD [Cronobacter muytjensii]
MPALLQLCDVAVGTRLGPITATLEAGDIVHLVGPNGAGKSTLLHRMAGLADGGGDILFDSKPLASFSAPALARKRAYLAQQQTPPFAMPVWHYLTLHGGAQCGAALEAVARCLMLDDKLTRPVNTLSGGEWQRVRLAAVIVQIHPLNHAEGRVLILDEPMNSLDVAQQAALDRLLVTLSRAGIAVVMSSHDLNHTLRHARRVWLLCEGKLLAHGPRDEVMTPARLGAAYGLPFRRLQVDGHSLLINTL